MLKLARLLPLVLLPAALLAAAPSASAAPLSGSPARIAGLDADWTCSPKGAVYTGDGLRRLSVCLNTWVSDPYPTQWRAEVQLRSQKLYGNQWYDSVSQSITVNEAEIWTGDTEGAGPRFPFGNDQDHKCRVNGAGSSQIACSVPNTSLVTFYSAAWNGVAQSVWSCTKRVTWRDDIGRAHTGDYTNGGAFCDYD